MVRQPLVGQGFPIVEASRSHTDTPQSIGLLWRAARYTDLYLTILNTHKSQTSMQQAGFEPTVPTSERPQTHALDHVATGTGKNT